MQAQGLWDKVVIVTGSDFGRVSFHSGWPAWLVDRNNKEHNMSLTSHCHLVSPFLFFDYRLSLPTVIMGPTMRGEVTTS